MPRFMDVLRRAWFSTKAELAKGGITGYWLRITQPKRFREASNLRPDKRQLVKSGKEIKSIVEEALGKNRIRFSKVFYRVKSIGSLDRTNRYVRIKFPERGPEYLREDLLGVTLIMKDNTGVYEALNVLKKVGNFPRPPEEGRGNPRDYFKNPKPARDSDLMLEGIITGNFVVGNHLPVHLRIFTEQSYKDHIVQRGTYKRSIRRTIKKGK